MEAREYRGEGSKLFVLENRGLASHSEGTGFTPVRRRQSTINTRSSQGDEKEWTASRCNRLLRVLTSRISLLKKELSRSQSSTADKTHTVELKKATKRGSSLDEEWSIGRKRIKQTYGRCGKTLNKAPARGPRITPLRKGTRLLLAGEVLVPTPIFNRARGEIIEGQLGTAFAPPEVSFENPLPNYDKSKKRPRTKVGEAHSCFESMRELKKTIPHIRYSVYEGIYKGLEALLKATAPDKNQVKLKGARSLLSACLKIAPKYIAEEEMALEAELQEIGGKSAIKNRDISTEIYEELEAFGTSGRGWKHLRIVVRSHGIQVICDAIENGLLDVEFCGILISLCSQTDAVIEGESLLSSLLSNSTYSGPKSIFTRFSDDLSNRPLLMLQSFVVGKSCSFQYRQLSSIIETGLLSLEWLTTKEFSPIWTRAIQDLSLDSTSSAPYMFMVVMLSKLAQLSERRGNSDTESVLFEAKKQTFSSLLTTLTSIVILSQETASQIQSNGYGTEHCSGPFLAILRSCLVQWETSCTINTQGTLLLLSNLLAGWHDFPGPKSNPTPAGPLLNHLQRIKLLSPTIGNELVAFICSTARCCGRGTPHLGFEHLERFHLLLEPFACDKEPDGGNTLHEIIVDSAFAFAQQAPTRKHLDYATRLETKYHVVKTKRASSAPGTSSGFRWEEGISEWVAVTPAPNLENRADKFKCGTPIRHDVRLRRERNTAVRADLKSQHTRYFGLMQTLDISPQSFVSSPISTNASSSQEEPHPTSSRSNSFASLGSVDSELSPAADQNVISATANINSDPVSSFGFDDVENTVPEDSFGQGCLSLSQLRKRTSDRGRQFISRAPRLSRKVVLNSRQWQLFDDESDDELSFCSSFHSTLSQAEQVMQDITNTAPRVSHALRSNRHNTQCYKPVNFKSTSSEDSEDELCT
jgi:hypothetical protein